MFSAQRKNRCDFEKENWKIGNQLSQDSVEPPMLNSYSAKQLFGKQLFLQYTSYLIAAYDINVQVSRTYQQNNFLTQEKQFSKKPYRAIPEKRPSLNICKTREI